jgi:hypothetical protein
VEPRLAEHVKSWRVGTIDTTDAVQFADYHVYLKKKGTPDELLALFRASGADQVLDIEILT